MGVQGPARFRMNDKSHCAVYPCRIIAAVLNITIFNIQESSVLLNNHAYIITLACCHLNHIADKKVIQA